jgi:hypothetical protein
MTKDEALKLALAALGLVEGDIEWQERSMTRKVVLKAITALREALAEQPAQRKPLTDEEIKQFASKHLDVGDGSYATHFVTGDVAFARAIEAAHNIKENT